MVLLLQGRGYNLRRGVHFRDGGTSACSHEGGTVAVSLVFVSVFREAYDRTKPTEEGRASALRGRLQSVDPTKLNINALAPRAAGRAEASLRALLLVLWRATRTGRERSCALCTRFAPAEVSAYASPSPRRVATSVGYHPPVSLEGGTDPLGTCSRPMGGGTINRGGTLNRT